MGMYSKETYTAMLDQMLSFELQYDSSFASESNIKNAMKKILGSLIRKGVLKRYSGLVLDESLNVHVTILDAENGEFDIMLVYGV